MENRKSALPYAALALLGVAVGFAATWLLLPKPTSAPCTNPPKAYHTVTIKWDPSQKTPLVVSPMILDGVEQCDVVTFVNMTSQTVKIDFTNAPNSEGTPFNETPVFDIDSSSQPSYTKAPRVIVQTPATGSKDYPYLVSAGGVVEQSPVIRIGPKKTVNDS